MSAPFVAELRSRPEVVRMGSDGAGLISVRVQVPEIWDVVRVETPPGESVLAVKNAALQVLVPRADQRQWVVKLRGFEVLDETQTLAEAGAIDGSIFLLTHRRRRPVR